MKLHRLKLLVVALVLLVPAALPAQHSSDWRQPVNSDLGDDYTWRKEDPELYLTAKADFDGDGKIDTAKLFINDKENKMGLFVTWSSSKKVWPALLLDTTDMNEMRSMGIRVIKPGHYKTACGKGYWPCKKEEPEILSFKQPAIDFFTYESASSYFIWDKKAKAFKRIWMSD